MNIQDRYKHEAMFYENTTRGLKCTLCPHECILRPDHISMCHNRINENNKVYSIAYGNPSGVNIDPVEKKPLYHFNPGTEAFSIGVAGCNFACLNCQNREISQCQPGSIQNYDLMPGDVIKQCSGHNCFSIAYTYTEPTTFYEYMIDTATRAKALNIKNIYVSNGYINEQPLRKLCSVLDAASIDIKVFDETLYRRLTTGKLQPVLNTLKILKEEGIWLEISNLIIPGWSDDPDMIHKMCDWLATNGFADQPLHFLRFYPKHKLSGLKPTSLETLLKSREVAQNSGIKYVYIGNVPSEDSENTICPNCKKILIKRNSFQILQNSIVHGKCAWCGTYIAGIWE